MDPRNLWGNGPKWPKMAQKGSQIGPKTGQNGLFWAIFGTPSGRPFQLTLSWSADLGHIRAKRGQKGVPKWAIFGPPGAQIGQIGPFIGQIGPFIGKIGHFGLYLAYLGPQRAQIGQKGPFWAILGHFGPFWAYLAYWASIGLYRASIGPIEANRAKRAILGHFGPFWAILGLFGLLGLYWAYRGL